MAPQPFKGFPANFRPHVRPFYRFAATGLGASMWFFVRYTGPRSMNFERLEFADYLSQLMYRAKKDGS